MHSLPPSVVTDIPETILSGEKYEDLKTMLLVYLSKQNQKYLKS